jgi:hypothetical protein
MKAFHSTLHIVAACVLLAATAVSAAQDLPPRPDVAQRPPSAPVADPGPGAGLPPRPLDDRVAALVTINGVVQRYVINPEGDVDGLLLADNALVHFPPHLGTEVTAAVVPGDSVTVTGFALPGDTVQAQRIENAKRGRTVVDQPPPLATPRFPRELAGAGLVRLDVTGRVLRVTTAPRGEADGMLLTDGTVIKLTPPVAMQFADLLRPGTMVAAQGYGTRNRYGQAMQATAFGTPGKLTTLYGTLPQ